MPYPEFFVAPMREELTSLGIEELRTPGEVDQAIANSTGTVMVVVNSVCGCAAGKARPGLALALRNGVRPDRVVSVFAGFDGEATDRARSYFTGYAPSSPSIALFRDGSSRTCSNEARSRIVTRSPSRTSSRARSRNSARRQK
jgi:putative YphP/YqiW family bacilliredoxin